MEDKLFGYLGIDTKYEKELIYYRPLIKALRGLSGNYLDPDRPKDNKLLRVEQFTLTKVVTAYEDLISRIKKIVSDIEKREDPTRFQNTKTLYESGRFQELLAFDQSNDKVTHRSYIDFHYICLLMLTSLDSRLVEILNKYGKQFTESNTNDAIFEAEALSIQEMNYLYYLAEQLEPNTNQELYETHDHGGYDGKAGDGRSIDGGDVAEVELADVQMLIEEKNIFHQTIADLSMIHQNRCAMLDEMCDIIEVMVNKLFNLYDEEMSEAIHLLYENNGANSLLLASAENFETIKTKQLQQKAKMFEYQERIESFSFDKQYFYQQLEQTYNNKALAFLGNTIYESNSTLERMNRVVISAVEHNKSSYNMTIKDALNYYKQEAEVMKTTLDLAIDKEEVRLFYHVADLLRNTDSIDNNWTDNFLEKMRNY